MTRSNMIQGMQDAPIKNQKHVLQKQKKAGDGRAQGSPDVNLCNSAPEQSSRQISPGLSGHAWMPISQAIGCVSSFLVCRMFSSCLPNLLRQSRNKHQTPRHQTRECPWDLHTSRVLPWRPSSVSSRSAALVCPIAIPERPSRTIIDVSR